MTKAIALNPSYSLVEGTFLKPLQKKKEFKKIKDLTLKELEELKASLKENNINQQ